MLSIEYVADQLISQAVKQNATDVHVIPRTNDSLIKFRVDQQLIPQFYLPSSESERLISHFKFMASMDIGEKRKPQSGALTMQINNMQVGLRLSTLPSTRNESLVIRILPPQNQLPLHRLSLFPKLTLKLLSLLKHAHGLMVLTGPTGSGKTTTLYSLIQDASYLHNRHVITLEDPVEKKSDDVLQVQVNEKAGITYNTGLKAILRHDPDIIMVGEIRDAETAQIAVRAALTGHLVLTSMHTRNAEGAIYRLMEFGVNWKEIEQTLIAISAQRLVELTCPFCATQCSPFCRGINYTKRANVFELLYGKTLSLALEKANGKNVTFSYPSLKKIICKGIALGYIKESEYDRWVYDETSF